MLLRSENIRKYYLKRKKSLPSLCFFSRSIFLIFISPRDIQTYSVVDTLLNQFSWRDTAVQRKYLLSASLDRRECPRRLMYLSSKIIFSSFLSRSTTAFRLWNEPCKMIRSTEKSADFISDKTGRPAIVPRGKTRMW